MPSLAPSRIEDGAVESAELPAEPRVATSSAVVPALGQHAAPGVVLEQKYELVRLLGEGGMGAVWVANHLTLDVHVALKVMRGELARQVPGAAERMLQEARAAACIGHPAIVQVFDFGRTSDGDPFISMELLHGESLAEALARRGRLPPARAVQVLLPIADALALAHLRGIVHRDLKPDNVFLARLADGRVQPKILDFGVAKLETQSLPKLTLDGAVLGSPAYMAPEQAWGEKDVDQRVDVWAFGVMLYELLTGATPFFGESYNALLFAITRDEPRSIVDHGVNEPELWRLVERCLSKDRAARFGDLRQLGRELAQWLLARGVSTDITKAPLTGWVEHRAAGYEASLFPSLSPGGSSAPPARVAVTAAREPETPGPAVAERAAGERAVFAAVLRRGVGLERREEPAPEPAPRARRARAGQFAAIALLSAGAFLAAAYYQSAQPGKAEPPSAGAVPAPAPADQDAVAPRIEPAGEPPPAHELSSATRTAATATGPAPAAAAEATRPRPRARRRAASSDLKNPFD